MMKPRLIINPFNIIRSRKGFGIIEVMVAAGLLLIISVGMTTLLTNMQKEQRRQSLLQNLSLLQARFESAIKNPDGWSKTINNPVGSPTNTNMECLRKKVTCDGTSAAPNPPAPGNYVNSTNPAPPAAQYPYINNTAAEIVLKDASGGTFYDGRQTSNTVGYTESGGTCSGFSYNPASGNDACPIGYVVNWRALSNDPTPQLSVYSKLIFNPSDTNPFKSFVNANLTSTGNKYDINVLRTATATTKSFMVTFNKSVSGAGLSNCSTGGFGSCSTSFVNFGFGGNGIVAFKDPYGLIDKTYTSAVRLIYPGSYKCNAKSYAFGTNGAQLQLYQNNNTAGVLAGPVSSFASKDSYGYTTLIMDSTFDFTQPNTDILMQQKCETNPTSNAIYPPNEINPQLCGLGFAANPYTGGTAEMATLNCIKIE